MRVISLSPEEGKLAKKYYPQTKVLKWNKCETSLSRKVIPSLRWVRATDEDYMASQWNEYLWSLSVYKYRMKMKILKQNDCRLNISNGLKQKHILKTAIYTSKATGKYLVNNKYNRITAHKC